MNDGHDLTNKQTPDTVALNVCSVSKIFAAKPVLRKIDLYVPGGQAVCLCGINGAGKSTLLRVIAGLLHPDSGSVEINAHCLRKHPEKAKRGLGMISHASMVYPELTVVENLMFAARLYSVPDRKRRIQELLARTELAAFRHDRAGILSRGLLQRLAIARAMVHKPAVVLADEPFTGLDARASERLLDIFRDFVRGGSAILMTTHDVRVGLRCCDRMTVLDEGVLVFDAMKDRIDLERFAQDYLSYAKGSK
jgi:heme exporter protein A